MPSKEDILDKIKIDVFRDKNIGALFGALLCNIEWEWSDKIPTASTNGKRISFNEEWVKTLSSPQRLFLALHEMHHIFRLHQLRMGDRDPTLWNTACDLIINQSLVDDGFAFIPGGLLDTQMLKDFNLESEEDVYEHLLKHHPDMKCKPFGHPDENGDMEESEEGLSPMEKRELIEAVSTSITQAKLAGEAGNMLGQVESHIDSFLNPEIPWNQALRKFFIAAGGTKRRNWSKRNKRYRSVYLPKRQPDNDLLTKVLFFLDTSGSVSDDELRKYLGEIKHVQEVLEPVELQVVQFDWSIQKVDTYTKGNRIRGMDITGRGGTSLDAVREYIINEKPTVVVIFSDLECYPMEDPNVPIIWITQKTPCSWEPKYGKQYIIK